MTGATAKLIIRQTFNSLDYSLVYTISLFKYLVVLVKFHYKSSIFSDTQNPTLSLIPLPITLGR